MNSCPFCKSDTLNGIRTHTLHCTRLRPIVRYNYPNMPTVYVQAMSLQDARLIATHCVYDACAANGMSDTTAAHIANNRALVLKRNDAVFNIAGTGASVSIM